MATLTDEEKAAKLAEGVDEPKTQDEPTEPTDDPAPPGDDSPEEPAAPDEEKPTEDTAEEPTTFTKQFQNLKGDSWDEYGPELETAYQNSFSEGLKLRQQLDEANKRLTEAPTQTPPNPTTPSTIAPELQEILNRAKAREDREMVEAFGEFAKNYPQAQEITSNDAAFQRFQTASQGVGMAIGAGAPYKELFEKTAAVLGWQPSSARKDAAIKDAAAASDVPGGSPKPVPKVNVTQKELDAAKRMLGPTYDKSETELLKDLATIKSQ